jgi:hypothetical protein
MLKKNIFIFFGYVVFIANLVFAAHPLATDDVGVVDVAKYELEVVYDNCKGEEIPRNHSCGLSLKQGITERMDMGISFPYQVKPRQTEAIGTANLGIKFSLIKDILALTINNELGSGEYFINGIFSKEIKFATMHFNFGYSASGDEDTKGTIVYSWAFEHSLSKADLVGEILGEKKSFEDWLLGNRYKIADATAVSLGYGNGFKKTNEKITVGFHTEF